MSRSTSSRPEVGRTTSSRSSFSWEGSGAVKVWRVLCIYLDVRKLCECCLEKRWTCTLVGGCTIHTALRPVFLRYHSFLIMPPRFASLALARSSIQNLCFSRIPNLVSCRNSNRCSCTLLTLKLSLKRAHVLLMPQVWYNFNQHNLVPAVRRPFIVRSSARVFPTTTTTTPATLTTSTSYHNAAARPTRPPPSRASLTRALRPSYHHPRHPRRPSCRGIHAPAAHDRDDLLAGTTYNSRPPEAGGEPPQLP